MCPAWLVLVPVCAHTQVPCLVCVLCADAALPHLIIMMYGVFVCVCVCVSVSGNAGEANKHHSHAHGTWHMAQLAMVVVSVNTQHETNKEQEQTTQETGRKQTTLNSQHKAPRRETRRMDFSIARCVNVKLRALGVHAACAFQIPNGKS